MQSERNHPPADLVVAWHKHHLLAERVTPDQAHGIGVVALPFAWRCGQLLPADTSEVARATTPPDEGPKPSVTKVTNEAEALADAAAAPAAVLGARRWSRVCCTASAAVLAVVALSGLGAVGRPSAEPARTPTLPAQAAPPAPAASAAAEPAMAAAEPEAAPQARPADVDPRRGTVELPPKKPVLGAEARLQARAEAEPLRRATAAARRMAPRAYALVSATTRERSDSERVAQQLQGVAQLRPGPGALRAELVRVDAGWRAVCWPFASARDAEKVRLVLAYRGLKTELVEF